MATFGKFQSKRTDIKTQGQFNLVDYLATGAVPDRYYGSVHTGKSALGPAAHRVQYAKQIDNLANNTVSSQLKIKIEDENGVVTTPIPLFGKMRKPDSDGYIRFVDEGKIKQAMEVKAYRDDVTKRIVDIVRTGDHVAAYLFGYTLDEWDKICNMDAGELKKLFTGMHISEELAKHPCTVQEIESYPPLSVTQTVAIAKLKKICEYLADSVNLETLTSVEEEFENMKEGTNTTQGISERSNALLGDKHLEYVKGARERLAEREPKPVVTVLPAGGVKGPGEM